MARGKAIKTIVEDEFYIILELDNGGTRYGIKGAGMIDRPERFVLPEIYELDELEDWVCSAFKPRK